MNLQYLEYFVALTRTESFTKAAQLMHVSQSAVSTAVSKLESELNVPLVDRASKNFKLTRYGELLAYHAKNILGDVDELKADMESQRQRETSGLLIGVIGNYDFDLLHSILTGFRKEEGEQTQFTLRQGTYGELLDAMQEGDLDFSFGANSPNSNPPLGTERIFLQEVPLWCNVAATSPLARQETIDAHDLDGMTVAHYSPTMQKLYSQQFNKQTEINFKFFPYQLSIPAAEVLVALGECVGFDNCAWQERNARIASRPLVVPENFQPWYSVMRTQMFDRPSLTKRFWQYCQNRSGYRKGGESAE